jgi:hypothetical protein
MWPSFERLSTTSASRVACRDVRTSLGITSRHGLGSRRPVEPLRAAAMGTTVLTHRDAIEAELFQEEGEGVNPAARRGGGALSGEPRCAAETPEAASLPRPGADGIDQGWTISQIPSKLGP